MAQALGDIGRSGSADGEPARPDFALLAGLVGTMVLARAVGTADRPLADRILSESVAALAARTGPENPSSEPGE